MSVRMKLSFVSPPAEDHNKAFLSKDSTDSLEERKVAFKQDNELMNETNKFVNELIEQAQIEAAKRAEQTSKANGDGFKRRSSQTIAGWNNRARGFCNRVWNAVVPCFNNNELLAWTQPLRYRFTRP
ncbi:uncharacterized protein LOC106650983 [Trichogramma pretiosum]|uniref:uncharacterized protein LOC106650983 n=1 Tax=Trichogramma pretiosum TaxID=7493 RepID=UPI0006C96491|nr:uncharacterized protein LOC106650983 [Trichogramma pretiosum]